MVKIFKNFKEVQTVKPGFAAERIFGGALLAIAGADFICFYDWTQAKVRRRRRASPCTDPWMGPCTGMHRLGSSVRMALTPTSTHNHPRS